MIYTHWLEKSHKRHQCVSLGKVLLQVELVVKNTSANVGDGRDAGSIPGLRRSPVGGHGEPLQLLAWRIPWTDEPGGLQSMESQTVGTSKVTQHACCPWNSQLATGQSHHVGKASCTKCDPVERVTPFLEDAGVLLER